MNSSQEKSKETQTKTEERDMRMVVWDGKKYTVRPFYFCKIATTINERETVLL